MLLPVLLVLLTSAAALQLGVVTPARLSEAVLQAAANQTVHSQCTQDFTRWTAALSSGERWAAEMADSWTKSFTGLLHGNTWDLGDFDECIYASSETAKKQSSSLAVIRGAYMLTSVSIASSQTMSAEQQRVNLSSAALLLRQVVPVGIKVALCVPESCDKHLLVSAAGSVANDLLNEEKLNGSFRVSVSLLEGKLQSEATAYKPGALHWIYLGCMVFVALLAVVATLLEYNLDGTDSKEARRRWRYLLHFSLGSGMRRLMAPAPASSMTSINGIRVLSTLWIVVGHTWDYWPPIINSRDMSKFTEGVSSNILSSYTLSVDTFLTVGGLVCCFSFMRSVKKNGFNWIKYIIHRYARTTPAVAVVTIYGVTWYNTQTPGVDSYVIGEKALTRWFQEFWWTNFLHISNFFAPLMASLPHTWYVSIDMQLYIAAPVVMIQLWKRPLVGKVILAFIAVVSCVIPGVFSIVYKAKNMSGSDDSSFEELWTTRRMLYMETESRISPYVVGIAAGYLLHELKYGNLKIQFTKLHAAIMWILSTATALAVVLGSYSIDHDKRKHPYNVVESFFYLGFTKLAWGVAISLVIIACETGCGGPVHKFLSLKIFAPLGRISFTVYLVHYFIVGTEMAYLVHVVEYFSMYIMIRRVFSSLSMALVLATLLSLLIEQPFMLIENELWK